MKNNIMSYYDCYILVRHISVFGACVGIFCSFGTLKEAETKYIATSYTKNIVIHEWFCDVYQYSSGMEHYKKLKSCMLSPLTQTHF